MSLSLKDEERIKSYLLGGLLAQHAQELEEQLVRDDDFAEQMIILEDELIEDFARGVLSTSQRVQFETNFLRTPKRRRKLMLVRKLREYSSAIEDVRHIEPSTSTPYSLLSLLVQRWQIVALTLVILTAGLTVWRVFFFRSDKDSALLALNEAYKIQRPIAARVTQLSYSPYAPTRGNNSDPIDARLRDRSVALSQQAVQKNRSPAALHTLGRVYLLQKEFDKAVLQFEEILKLTPEDPQLHSDLGAALFEKGKLQRLSDQSGRGETTLATSLEHLNRALDLNNSLPDALFNRALLYQQMNLLSQAIADWEKYLVLDPNSSWTNEARGHLEVTKKRMDLGTRASADTFREFIDAQKANNERLAWQMFSKSYLRTGNSITNKLVDAYVESASLMRNEHAEEQLQALTEIGQLSIRNTGDRFTTDIAQTYRLASAHQLARLRQARNLMNAGHQFYNQSRNDQAIENYSQAKVIFKQLAHVPEVLFADFWMGFCYLQQGDTKRSLTIMEGVIRQSETKSYKWLQSIAYVGLANAKSRATRYSQAVDDSWAAYKLSKQANDDNGLLRSLNMLASLYRNLGKYRQSLQLSQEGFELGNKIAADASQMIGFYATSAWDFNSLGHYAAALEFEKQALKLGDEMNNPLVQSRYHVQMGLIQANLKDYQGALQSIQHGLEISQSLENEKIASEMASYAQLYLGRTYRESGQYSQALLSLTAASNFGKQNDQRWIVHTASKEQLLTYLAQGHITETQEELKRVLAAYEDQREQIREESNRNSFFAKEQNIYDVAIDFAQGSQREPQQAFEYSESSRARSLLDAVSTDLRIQNEDTVPDLHFSRTLKPIPLSEIQQQLPDQIQLLQYAVVNNRIVSWYVTNTRFENQSVNIGSEELAKKVERLVSLMSSVPREDDTNLLRMATELYDLLIRPWANILDRQKQLCVIPDKSLNLLPFSILFSSTSKTYLVEDFTLSYASSSNMFVRDTRLATEKRNLSEEHLLSVGNPRFDTSAFPDLADLPSAAKEAREVCDFYKDCSPLIGTKATRDSVQVEMLRADVVHLATHFLPDETSPMLSKLLLASDIPHNGEQPASDGVLRAFEVYKLGAMKPRLIILSACQTAVEDYYNGEGAMGFSRPFKTGGVPLVIASLWPVDTDATTELMIEFHRLRKREGFPSAKALRTAQVQMLRHNNLHYRHPYYWAAFVLNGGYSDY